MKLYATLETGRGKTVSVSDNDIITATVYDGNMKAYSVIIEWCALGDCTLGHDHESAMSEPCEPEMGAIVTTREWRNREKTDDRHKAQRRN